MASNGGQDRKDTEPLYNSRGIKNYVEYTKMHHPDVDIDSVLRYADMASYQMEDQGHWFSQHQVDRFHDILVKKTGNQNISRDAGRHAASSGELGPVKQYALDGGKDWLSVDTGSHLQDNKIGA
jgi:hypothetical protein